MSPNYCRFLKLLLATVTVLQLASSASTEALENSKIDRIIDLSSQLVKITDRIHVEGNNVGVYKISLDPAHKDRLAYIGVSVSGQPMSVVAKSDGSYEVDLTGQTAKPMVVTTVYTKLLKPYPAEIKQADKQLVQYQGLQAPFSAYLTRTATTKIKLPQSSRLESFTKAAKMTTGTNKLTYGPFKDVQPNSKEPLIIHYENNSPFVAVTDLQRSVEVSPWGRSISIVNYIRVEHVGAKLKGPFSRIDYQRDHFNGVSSVKNFAIELPKTSRDIFYRDGIGNISTSSIKLTSTHTVVAMKPRFPLFGGWGTDFNLGYRVPINQFLNEPVSGNNYRLSIPFVDILYDNMFIEDATIRITLPSGANDVDVKGAIDFDRLSDEHNYSYLDVIGRKVVVLKKKNVVEQHLDGKPIIIRYNYSKIYMLQEPLLILAAAVATLVVIALYSKLSSKTSQSAQGGKLKSD